MILIPYAFHPEVANVYAHLAFIIPSTMHTYPVFIMDKLILENTLLIMNLDPHLDIQHPTALISVFNAN